VPAGNHAFPFAGERIKKKKGRRRRWRRRRERRKQLIENSHHVAEATLGDAFLAIAILDFYPLPFRSRKHYVALVTLVPPFRM